MSQKVGPLESSFFIHLSGLVATTLLLTVGLQSGSLGQWRTVPWYALCAGVLGVVVIVSVSYTIPRIGIAAAVTLLVAAQLSTGVLMDQLGLLGNIVRPLDLPRLAGLGLLFSGTWLLVK
jgi:transporter family-2 protein